MIARELIRRLGRGEFEECGYEGESGWVHAETGMGHVADEGVMKRLGAEGWGWSWDVKVDLGGFF